MCSFPRLLRHHRQPGQGGLLRYTHPLQFDPARVGADDLLGVADGHRRGVGIGAVGNDLRLIAGANGRTDALDHDVVEAYWIGNQLLSHVGPHDFGVSIDDRFRRRLSEQ